MALSTTAFRNAGSISCAAGIPRIGLARVTTTSGPAPQSLSELLSEPGVVEFSRLRSRFGFLAIHGGGLEQMTDVIAERAAEAADASVYLLRHPDRYPHHLSSVQFDPERVGAARGVSRPRRRRGLAARLWPHRTQHTAAGRRT